MPCPGSSVVALPNLESGDANRSEKTFHDPASSNEMVRTPRWRATGARPPGLARSISAWDDPDGSFARPTFAARCWHPSGCAIGMLPGNLQRSRMQ
jgi:hypothetical protein